jgi:hypothetical protein
MLNFANVGKKAKEVAKNAKISNNEIEIKEETEENDGNFLRIINNKPI